MSDMWRCAVVDVSRACRSLGDHRATERAALCALSSLDVVRGVTLSVAICVEPGVEDESGVRVSESLQERRVERTSHHAIVAISVRETVAQAWMNTPAVCLSCDLYNTIKVIRDVVHIKVISWRYAVTVLT